MRLTREPSPKRCAVLTPELRSFYGRGCGLSADDTIVWLVTSWRRVGISAGLVAICTGVMLLAGCGDNSHSIPSGRVIHVNEHDFHISVQTDRVAAGDYVLRIHNGGPDQHELIVASDRRRGLPFRADGFTVNEEVLQSSEPGSVEPERPGGSVDLRVQLRPGRYVLFCNMAGHFMAGMHADLVVTR